MLVNRGSACRSFSDDAAGLSGYKKNAQSAFFYVQVTVLVNTVVFHEVLYASGALSGLLFSALSEVLPFSSLRIFRVPAYISYLTKRLSRLAFISGMLRLVRSPMDFSPLRDAVIIHADVS